MFYFDKRFVFHYSEIYQHHGFIAIFLRKHLDRVRQFFSSSKIKMKIGNAAILLQSKNVSPFFNQQFTKHPKKTDHKKMVQV